MDQPKPRQDEDRQPTTTERKNPLQHDNGAVTWRPFPWVEPGEQATQQELPPFTL